MKEGAEEEKPPQQIVSGSDDGRGVFSGHVGYKHVEWKNLYP